MGTDKSRIPVDGVPSAVRIARLLAQVVGPVIEVGPGCSGLPAVLEADRYQGPLAAVAAGSDELRRRGHHGPALVLACDLPRVGLRLLRYLAAWPGAGSVVPVVEGRDQYLCARFGTAALDAAPGLVAVGARKVRVALDAGPVARPGPDEWARVAGAAEFIDVDEPADLIRAGLAGEPG